MYFFVKIQQAALRKLRIITKIIALDAVSMNYKCELFPGHEPLLLHSTIIWQSIASVPKLTVDVITANTAIATTTHWKYRWRVRQFTHSRLRKMAEEFLKRLSLRGDLQAKPESEASVCSRLQLQAASTGMQLQLQAVSTGMQLQLQIASTGRQLQAASTGRQLQAASAGNCSCRLLPASVAYVHQ